MVVTTKEPFVVNGVALNTLAKNIESLTGRMRAPAFRTGNLVVPSKHGELRVPNKMFQANTIALGMWVAGCNDDGGIPAGKTARREFFDRADELVALFKGPDLLDMRWTKADGQVRQAYGEALDVFDFTVDLSPLGKVGVNLSIPDAFWRDAASRTQVLGAGGPSVTPRSFEGGTGPMEDLVYGLKGPWISPQLTFSDGSWWAWDGTIPAGISLIMNSGEWELGIDGAPTSYVKSGTTYTFPLAAKMADSQSPATSPGGAARTSYSAQAGLATYADGMQVSRLGWSFDYSRVRHDGADSVWAALPAPAAAIALSGGGRTTSTQLTLTGSRKYLIG